MSECGYTLPGWDHRFEGSLPCYLPDGHEGPHHSVTAGRSVIAWEQPDPSCGCADCVSSEDPMDACVAWGEVEGEAPLSCDDNTPGTGEGAGHPSERTNP